MSRRVQLRPRRSSNGGFGYFRRKLLDRRRELQTRLISWLRANGDTVEHSLGDTVDMASKFSEQEDAWRLVTSESDAISDINHALHKLDNGTYGICELCGKPIPPMRLRVLPYASLCVPCQQEQELERAPSRQEGEEWEQLDGEPYGDHFRDPEEVYETIRGTAL